MPDITRHGASIHYETAGEGPAMLLLHPLPHDHTIYLYQIAHFSTWFTVIAMDFRGFGRSRASARDYGLGDLCDDARAVCTAQGFEEAIVLGTSIGSKAALLLGLDHPDFCRAVIAVGAGNKPAAHRQAHIDDYRFRRETFHHEHLTSVVSPAFARAGLGQHFITTMEARARRLGMQGEEMARTVAAAHDRDLRPRLPHFKPPLLVINGEFDNSLSGGTETAALVPPARHAIIAGAGHACSLEAPAIFDALVIDFLKRCGVDASAR